VSPLTKITASDVMEPDFLIIDGMATVAEALAKMKEGNAHFVLVDKRSDDDEYGIVLVSDIAKQVLAKNRSPERVNVYEIMTKPVLSVQPDMDIRYCARLFEHFGILRLAGIEGSAGRRLRSIVHACAMFGGSGHW